MTSFISFSIASKNSFLDDLPRAISDNSISQFAVVSADLKESATIVTKAASAVSNNCVQRLKLCFGSSLNIKLKSTSREGTKIAIQIPCGDQKNC